MRVVDNRFRVAVPELADVVDFDGQSITGAIRAGTWVLSAEPGLFRWPVDTRRRVAVPLGVRHQLGLVDGVVVSLSADRRRVAIWPTHLLDAVMETSR